MEGTREDKLAQLRDKKARLEELENIDNARNAELAGLEEQAQGR